MAKITGECAKLNLGLEDNDFDRCHRVGPSGKYQSVLVKLCSWRARDVIYTNRKKLPFKVNHDLTKNRHEILDHAKDLINDDESVSNIVSFVFADRNCKLKFKTISNKFYGFSTRGEFMTLVDRIGSEQFMNDTFKKDELNCELYY